MFGRRLFSQNILKSIATPALSLNKAVIVSRGLVTVTSTLIKKLDIKATTLAKQPNFMLNQLCFSSTKKKRRLKMNKHKLKKRRKVLRYNTKACREI